MTTTASGDNSRALAAIAYILTWITGLIIYFVAPKDDHYARWHAVQAIGLGVFLFAIGIILGFLGIGMLSTLWTILSIIAVIIFAIKAYQGEKIRIPIVADMADKHA